MGPKASVLVLLLALVAPVALAQFPPDKPQSCIDAFNKLCHQCIILIKGVPTVDQMCALTCRAKNKDALREAGCKKPDEYEDAFANFVVRFNKQYADEKEFDTRFANFKATFIYIARENAKGTNTFVLGVNEFSDLTLDEFAQTYFGLLVEAPHIRPKKPWGSLTHLGTHKYRGEALPASVDWRDQGAVTKVKNQAQCGSCWAFSATGSMEGSWKIAGHDLVSLSEEQLVECSTQNSACQGGSMNLAFSYEEGVAVCTEASYPYTSGGGKVGPCQQSNCTAGIPKGGITGYKDVGQTEQDLMSAVAMQPISIAVEADKAVFQSYVSGVITGLCGTNLDHGILAIGYGTDNGQDYWLVKNSWGTGWGMDGFGKLERGKGGTGECGILSMTSYPIASKAASTVLV